MLRLVKPAIIGLLAGILYWIASEIGVNAQPMTIDEFYGEQFYAVIATLYAIITALLLVKGIESFNSLSSAINREGMQLRSINAYFFYFDDSGPAAPHIQAIRVNLATYAQNLVIQRSAEKVQKNKNVIDDCVREFAKVRPDDENDRVAIGEVMRGLDELRRLRAERINCSSQKIPVYLIQMLALMTVAIIIPFYFKNPDGADFNYYIIFTLATFGSFVYFLLNDINKPYDGLWKIDLSPYEEARDELRNDQS